MGLVRFYACEGDPFRVALKLVLKAREQGQTVQLCGNAAQLQRLSELLWSEPGFLAHAGPEASPAVRKNSSIWLAEAPSEPVPAVLINVSRDVDCSTSTADRVFEIVGPDESDRVAGRQRFRHYEQVLGQRPDHVKVSA